MNGSARAAMKQLGVAAGAVLLAGCGGMGGLFEGSADIEVREVGRSLYCNATGETPSVVLLNGAQAVLDWQTARGLTLAGGEALAQTSYALVEMGLRPTGGYGLAVARAAVLSGERVTLSATFVSPPPGSIQTQALSSPCVLVQLPRGRYALVEVKDQTGTVRATGGTPVPPAPVAPETTEPETPPAAPETTPLKLPPPAPEPPAPAEPVPGEPVA